MTTCTESISNNAGPLQFRDRSEQRCQLTNPGAGGLNLGFRVLNPVPDEFKITLADAFLCVSCSVSCRAQVKKIICPFLATISMIRCMHACRHAWFSGDLACSDQMHCWSSSACLSYLGDCRETVFARTGATHFFPCPNEQNTILIFSWCFSFSLCLDTCK